MKSHPFPACHSEPGDFSVPGGEVCSAHSMRPVCFLIGCGVVLALSCASMLAQEPASKLPDDAQRIMREYDQAVDAARTRAIQSLERSMASQTARANLEGALAIRKQIDDLSAPASDKAPVDKKLVGRWKIYLLDIGATGEIVFKSGLHYEATPWFPAGTATINNKKLKFGDGVEFDISKGVGDELFGEFHGLKRRMERMP